MWIGKVLTAFATHRSTGGSRLIGDRTRPSTEAISCGPTAAWLPSMGRQEARIRLSSSASDATRNEGVRQKRSINVAGKVSAHTRPRFNRNGHLQLMAW